MHSFIYEALPSRVIFGNGALDQLAAEIERLHLAKVMVLSTPHHRQVSAEVAAALGDRSAGVYDQVVMHVPLEKAQAAREEALRRGAQGCVALGGGSTIGLGKAIALAHDLPIIAVPTTYAGSEMTPIWGITENGVKKTGRDPKVLPRTVIYDPSLTVSLPARLSVASGLNAIAHAVEGLYAQDANPIVSLMAEEGIRALAMGLPRIHADPQDLAARSDALYGAWLCGATLGAVGMALHHKICHTLGGSFNLPHAETHAVILPHAAAYNRAAAVPAMARIARALGATDAPSALHDLAKRMDAPLALKDLGLASADLDRAVDLIVARPYWNPAPVEPTRIRVLLERAWRGLPPE
ncbi:maleylacetate reductase [Nordella sp. HKS 07]|nr:maleylacetate reductase [Nordella sp. HKS 07]